MKTRVLVVDDSALVRAVLSEVVNATPDMLVVGVAKNSLEARELIKSCRPDVMTLDVDMPHLDGLAFLERVVQHYSIPVVVVSGLAEPGSDVTLKALELGAVGFVSKPRLGSVGWGQAYAEEICKKIRAARVLLKRGGRLSDLPVDTVDVDMRTPLAARVLKEKFVLIGASTGGTEAIKEVLVRFPEQMPSILIVQHMPEMFTCSFAKRLDGLCKIRVKEAEDGELLRPGVAYVAPGHSHLSVRPSGAGLQCELLQTEPVNRHRPSVDVLFRSAARYIGARGVGVMLTGMGKDGAQGMLAMRHAGAYNICQNQESSVVWGMPREATINGAAHETAALCDVAGRVMVRLRGAEGNN